jgi:hypothetical protein
MTSVPHTNDKEEIKVRLIAQFQVLKLGMLWTTKKRILQVTNIGIITIDPATFRHTNTIEYESITSLVSDESSEDSFTLIAGGTNYTFKSVHRSQLLCQLIECATSCCNKLNQLFLSFGPFEVQRMKKNKIKIDCKLTITGYGIIETDPSGKVLQQYKYVNVSRYGTDETANVFFFVHSDRIKIFISIASLNKIMEAVKNQLKLLGVNKPAFFNSQNANEAFEKRKDQV